MLNAFLENREDSRRPSRMSRTRQLRPSRLGYGENSFEEFTILEFSIDSANIKYIYSLFLRWGCLYDQRPVA